MEGTLCAEKKKKGGGGFDLDPESRTAKPHYLNLGGKNAHLAVQQKVP